MTDAPVAVDTRWVCLDADGLIWEQLDGDVALFQSASGQTHFLTPMAASVLVELSRGQCSLGELARVAEPYAEGDPLHEVRDSVEALLGHFKELSLVARIED